MSLSQKACHANAQWYTSIPNRYYTENWFDPISSVAVLTRINDSQCAHPEVFTTGCTQLNVVPAVVMDSRLGQHGIILNFRFSAEKQPLVEPNTIKNNCRRNKGISDGNLCVPYDQEYEF